MNVSESVLEAPLAAGPREGSAPNRAVVPEAVSQFTVIFSAEDHRFAGIPLPPELSRAVAKRQLHFRAGRFCAARALAALGRGPDSLHVARGKAGAPVWPEGIAGSITHTEGFASAAVARTSDFPAIGIDTEPIVSSARARNIAQAVAWACELAEARGAGCDRLEALTLVFSAKESIFKCLHAHVGRWFGFHDVRLVEVDGRRGAFRVRVVKTLSEGFPADTMLDGRFEIDGPRVHTGVALAARE
jgi:enterobactin synthetase component D